MPDMGVVGGVVGGWLAREMGIASVQGFTAAVVVAVFGALIVRLVLNALDPA